MRIDGVGAQGGDVGVAVLSRQPGQRHRAQEIGDERRVGAGEGERAGLHEVSPQPGGGQKLTEENELAQRRDRGVRIPFDMETPPVRVDHQRPVEHRADGGGAGIGHLTRRVSIQGSNLQWHGPFQQPLASECNSANCRIEVE